MPPLTPPEEGDSNPHEELGDAPIISNYYFYVGDARKPPLREGVEARP